MPILNVNDVKEVSRFKKFIENNKFSKYMQSMSWNKVKNNWDSDYVYIENNKKEIIAAISILSIKNDNENSFMYAPRGPICDPYDIDTVKLLIKESQKIIKNRNGFLLRMDPEIEYDETLIELYKKNNFIVRTSEDPSTKGFSNPAYNMILDLKGLTEDNLLNSLKGKLRNLIKKTYINGLKTRMISYNSENYEIALKNLYNLIINVSDRNKIGHRDKNYLDRIMISFENTKIFETYNEDNLILSSCIVITFNKKSYYLYAGSSNQLRNLNASYQMNYEAIKYALSIGSEYYDFGGIFGLTSNECNLFNFKNKFLNNQSYTRYIGEIDYVINEELYNNFINK